MSPDDACLYRVGADGWSTEVCAVSHSDSADVCITISELNTNDVISVRTSRHNVGAKISLDLLSATYKYNQSLQTKIQHLKIVYRGWRAIRGDGNCYYRYAKLYLL